MACPICSWSSENLDFLFLSETTFWRVCLAPNQSLLGRCVVHLKRHSGDLADLTEREILEFLTVVKNLERAVKSAFNATMFNWSCYMNLSYQEKPPNPHIHWWAIPRYDQPVDFYGLVFEDLLFGKPYDHQHRREIPQAMRMKIAEKIRETTFLSEKYTAETR